MRYDILISVLERMKELGEFKGYPEDTLNFGELEKEDLEYYIDWLDKDTRELVIGK